jgi:hypothetical protein
MLSKALEFLFLFSFPVCDIFSFLFLCEFYKDLQFSFPVCADINKALQFSLPVLKLWSFFFMYLTFTKFCRFLFMYVFDFHMHWSFSYLYEMACPVLLVVSLLIQCPVHTTHNFSYFNFFIFPWQPICLNGMICSSHLFILPFERCMIFCQI